MKLLSKNAYDTLANTLDNVRIMRTKSDQGILERFYQGRKPFMIKAVTPEGYTIRLQLSNLIPDSEPEPTPPPKPNRKPK